MVDSINSSNNNASALSTLLSTQLQQGTGVDATAAPSSATAAQSSATSDPLLTDSAQISDAAKSLASSTTSSDPFVSLLSSLAERQDAPYNADQVSYFKNLISTNQLSSYFSTTSDSDLANSLLSNSSIATAL